MSRYSYPIGAERKRRDGGKAFMYVKVAGNKWVRKARVVWQGAHGHLPKGHHLFYINENTLDDRLENLRVISNGDRKYVKRNNLLHANGHVSLTDNWEKDNDTTLRHLFRNLVHECAFETDPMIKQKMADVAADKAYRNIEKGLVKV